MTLRVSDSQSESDLDSVAILAMFSNKKKTSCTRTGSSQGALQSVVQSVVQSAGMASYGIDRIKQKENCQRWKGCLWSEIVDKLDY